MPVATGQGRRSTDFDIAALFAALDEQRASLGLSWQGVADQLWTMSAELNARRGDHPISPATLTGMARRNDTTCQHALAMLRWLQRSPEDFVAGGTRGFLPPCGPDRRLRWDLKKLASAMDERRVGMGLTWVQLAAELGCGPSQLSGLRTVRYAISMVLCMRIVAWIGRPSGEFIYAAEW